MGFLLQVGIMAGIGATKWIYQQLQADPKPPKPVREEITIPRVRDGAARAMVFGRCRVRRPYISWVGDVQTAFNDTTGRRTIGFDMLLSLGLPMGSGVTRGNSLAGPILHNVWYGDVKLPAPASGLPVFDSTLHYGQNVFRDALGGTGYGGWLRGAYYWHGGWTDNDFENPATRIGDRMLDWGVSSGRIPGLAGTMCLSLVRLSDLSELDPYTDQTFGDDAVSVSDAFPDHGFVFGEGTSIAAVSAEVSTYGDVISGVTQHRYSMVNVATDFGGCADPAEVIDDVLTNPLGKLGLSRDYIDTASFLAASQKLKSEKHGYSRAWEDRVEAEEVITDVCMQVDGLIRYNPTTRKFEFKLIRNDYNPASLPQINRQNCDRLEDNGSSGLTNLVNIVRVAYENRSRGYSVESESAINGANAAGQDGRTLEEQLQFLGCKHQWLAAMIASRELSARSRPLMKFTAEVDRSFVRVLPGDVVRVLWTDPDINNLVFRVTSVDRGTHKDRKIRLGLIQDHFYSYRQRTPSFVTLDPRSRFDPHDRHDP